MIGYNPSHLNTNETLLEAFHRVEEYLKANPQYQVYQSSAQYQDGKQEYALDTIVVSEGSKVGKGDVVLFSNVYYSVITAVSETTFSIQTATNFRGATGATGATGQQGAKGESGNATYFYNGMLGESTIDAQVSDITIPFGRTLQVDDILISSNASTFGAMAQVAGIVGGVATVDFIGKISTGGGGGGISGAWSTGTSGSIIVPSAGLYEFKLYDPKNPDRYVSGVLDWDGINIVNCYPEGVSDSIVRINKSGELYHEKTYAVQTDTMSYRKIGEA